MPVQIGSIFLLPCYTLHIALRLGPHSLHMQSNLFCHLFTFQYQHFIFSKNWLHNFNIKVKQSKELILRIIQVFWCSNVLRRLRCETISLSSLLGILNKLAFMGAHCLRFKRGVLLLLVKCELFLFLWIGNIRSLCKN
jgi:hypothetical protein